MESQKKAAGVLNEQEIDNLVKLWDETPCATAIEYAFASASQECFEHCGYDISALPAEQQDLIYGDSVEGFVNLHGGPMVDLVFARRLVGLSLLENFFFLLELSDEMKGLLVGA